MASEEKTKENEELVEESSKVEEKKGRKKEKAEKQPKEKEKVDIKREILSYVILLAIVAGVVLLINTFVLINAKIPSGSMENTIMENDQIFGNRLAYKLGGEPQRMDIIIFKFPDDESKLFIKRIIGLPGETVEIIDGRVYINGSNTSIDDSFCKETPQGDFGPYVVPEGKYFVMGDNRNHSNDSRLWTNKFVSRDQIVGKAVLRYWPLDKIGLL